MKPARQEQKGEPKLEDLLTIENSQGLPFLGMCLNEALRMDPPVSMSTFNEVVEDYTVEGFEIKAGTCIHFDLWMLHRNPKEWIEPCKFIPERFDPASKYSLTPSGAKRHPTSFGPFLGGRRVCIGKTFAEVSAKFLIPLILQNFDFELGKQPGHDFNNNVTVLFEPEMPVTISQRI